MSGAGMASAPAASYMPRTPVGNAQRWVDNGHKAALARYQV